jgi:hypothetical protein
MDSGGVQAAKLNRGRVRPIGCDEDDAKLNAALGKVARHKPPKVAQAKKPTKPPPLIFGEWVVKFERASSPINFSIGQQKSILWEDSNAQEDAGQANTGRKNRRSAKGNKGGEGGS